MIDFFKTHLGFLKRVKQFKHSTRKRLKKGVFWSKPLETCELRRWKPHIAPKKVLGKTI